MFNPYYSFAKRLLRLRSRPMVAKRQGVLWLLYPQDWIDNRILIGRPFESQQLAYAKECIRRFELRSFFDCGSNIGLYSIILGVEAQGLETVHSFEPVANTWGRLVANITLNDLKDKVTAHHYGLGDTDCVLPISIDSKSSGTATLGAMEHSRRKHEREDKVKICVFDDTFKASDERSFFKIDLEGYEENALVGMEQYLKNNICVLQIELWDRNRSAVYEWLKGRGYQKFHQIDGDYYFRNFNADEPHSSVIKR